MFADYLCSETHQQQMKPSYLFIHLFFSLIKKENIVLFKVNQTKINIFTSFIKVEHLQKSFKHSKI